MSDIKFDGNNLEEKLNNIIKENRKHIIHTDILIIIVIILILLLCFLGYKMGKIGYQETSSTSVINNNDNKDMVSIITVTEDDIDIQKIEDLNIFANEKFRRRKDNCTNVKWHIQILCKK